MPEGHEDLARAIEGLADSHRELADENQDLRQWVRKIWRRLVGEKPSDLDPEGRPGIVDHVLHHSRVLAEHERRLSALDGGPSIPTATPPNGINSRPDIPIETERYPTSMADDAIPPAGGSAVRKLRQVAETDPKIRLGGLVIGAVFILAIVFAFRGGGSAHVDTPGGSYGLTIEGKEATAPFDGEETARRCLAKALDDDAPPELRQLCLAHMRSLGLGLPMLDAGENDGSG